MQSPAGVVAIARHVKPGYEAAFEEAVRGVILAASTFPLVAPVNGGIL